MRNLWIWVFIPQGVVIGLTVHGDSVGMTIALCLLNGLICTAAGCWVTLSNAEARQKNESQALQKLREQYQIALQLNLDNMRTALIALSARALRKAAEKMVVEFHSNFENEEQMEAAINRATDIVNAEVEEIANLVGFKE